MPHTYKIAASSTLDPASLRLKVALGDIDDQFAAAMISQKVTDGVHVSVVADTTLLQSYVSPALAATIGGNETALDTARANMREFVWSAMRVEKLPMPEQFNFSAYTYPSYALPAAFDPQSPVRTNTGTWGVVVAPVSHSLVLASPINSSADIDHIAVLAGLAHTATTDESDAVHSDLFWFHGNDIHRIPTDDGQPTGAPQELLDAHTALQN